MESDDPDDARAWRLKQLEWSLQALAAPADRQLGLFPSFVCKADELALDFGDAHRACAGNHDAQPSTEADDVLRELERKLASMSRTGELFRADLWSDAALAGDGLWREVRTLAARALTALQWPIELPPQDPRDRGAHYVPGSR